MTASVVVVGFLAFLLKSVERVVNTGIEKGKEKAKEKLIEKIKGKVNDFTEKKIGRKFFTTEADQAQERQEEIKAALLEVKEEFTIEQKRELESLISSFIDEIRKDKELALVAGKELLESFEMEMKFAMSEVIAAKVSRLTTYLHEKTEMLSEMISAGQKESKELLNKVLIFLEVIHAFQIQQLQESRTEGERTKQIGQYLLKFGRTTTENIRGVQRELQELQNKVLEGNKVTQREFELLNQLLSSHTIAYGDALDDVLMVSFFPKDSSEVHNPEENIVILGRGAFLFRDSQEFAGVLVNEDLIENRGFVSLDAFCRELEQLDVEQQKRANFVDKVDAISSGALLLLNGVYGEGLWEKNRRTRYFLPTGTLWVFSLGFGNFVVTVTMLDPLLDVVNAIFEAIETVSADYGKEGFRNTALDVLQLTEHRDGFRVHPEDDVLRTRGIFHTLLSMESTLRSISETPGMGEMKELLEQEVALASEAIEDILPNIAGNLQGLFDELSRLGVRMDDLPEQVAARVAERLMKHQVDGRAETTINNSGQFIQIGSASNVNVYQGERLSRDK